MKLFACDCRPVYRKRMRRSAWMRVVSSRRLYHCLACDAVLWVAPADPEDLFRDSVAPDQPLGPVVVRKTKPA